MFSSNDYEQEFNLDILGTNQVHWPLFVGSSGGGGHNIANESIRKDILSLHKKNKLLLRSLNLPLYTPILPEEKNTLSLPKVQLNFCLFFLNKFQHYVPLRCLPEFPTRKEVDEEIKMLAAKNSQPRHYIDMVLDAFPSGYGEIAMWNLAHKKDQTKELNKMHKFQKMTEISNHPYVKKFFISKLTEAAKNHTPYTEVICTHDLALRALCDAVLFYNKYIAPKYQASSIFIHQFISDVLSNKTIHYLNALHDLTAEEKKIMILYGINLKRSADYQLNGFAHLINLSPQNNPMVRHAFKDKNLTNINFNAPINLILQRPIEKEQTYAIPADEKIATIMLGSQASYATIDYVKKLNETGQYHKIFVLGASPYFRKCLNEISAHATTEIVLLNHQDDCHLAPLMVRSNLLIIRGGGLTVMEQMAIPHLKDQIILVHCKGIDHKGQLSSGILWEDGNVDELIIYLHQWGVKIMRTTVDQILEQLNTLERPYPTLRKAM